MSENTAKKALKFYVVNANACDATRLQPQSVQGYDMVVINANTLITTPSARAALAGCAAVMNVNHHADLPEDGPVEVTQVNGKTVLHPGMTAPRLPTYLMVNGRLEIAPGCEQLLSHYCGMQVNGTVVCPESIAPLLAAAQVNGSIETYPDDCVLLDKVAVLDRAFVLRAKANTRYYAARRMVALDTAADYAALAAKGVQLVTESLLVADSLAGTVLPLLDERAAAELVPDGTVFVKGSAVLDEALLRRGTKLYVDGDLTVNRDAEGWLQQLEALTVTGDAKVLRGMVEQFRKLDARYARLRPMAGTVLCDRVNLKVDAAMLTAAQDGLQVEDCVNLTFAKDIDPALLRERLVQVIDCVNVSCTAAQRAAIEAVAQDVVSYRTPDDTDGERSGGIVSKVTGFAAELQEMLCSVGIDPDSIDLVRTVLGSKVVNGNTCRL